MVKLGHRCGRPESKRSTLALLRGTVGGWGLRIIEET